MILEQGDPVLVTTAHRGVFFGYFSSEEENTVTLKKARNCIYWPAEVRGFLGLSTSGPLAGSRVGPPSDEIKLYSVTAIIRVQKAAIEKWESAPWS